MPSPAARQSAWDVRRFLAHEPSANYTDSGQQASLGSMSSGSALTASTSSPVSNSLSAGAPTQPTSLLPEDASLQGLPSLDKPSDDLLTQQPWHELCAAAARAVAVEAAPPPPSSLHPRRLNRLYLRLPAPSQRPVSSSSSSSSGSKRGGSALATPHVSLGNSGSGSSARRRLAAVNLRVASASHGSRSKAGAVASIEEEVSTLTGAEDYDASFPEAPADAAEPLLGPSAALQMLVASGQWQLPTAPSALTPAPTTASRRPTARLLASAARSAGDGESTAAAALMRAGQESLPQPPADAAPASCRTAACSSTCDRAEPDQTASAPAAAAYRPVASADHTCPGAVLAGAAQAAAEASGSPSGSASSPPPAPRCRVALKCHTGRVDLLHPSALPQLARLLVPSGWAMTGMAVRHGCIEIVLDYSRVDEGWSGGGAQGGGSYGGSGSAPQPATARALQERQIAGLVAHLHREGLVDAALEPSVVVQVDGHLHSVTLTAPSVPPAMAGEAGAGPTPGVDGAWICGQALSGYDPPLLPIAVVPPCLALPCSPSVAGPSYSAAGSAASGDGASCTVRHHARLVPDSAVLYVAVPYSNVHSASVRCLGRFLPTEELSRVTAAEAFRLASVQPGAPNGDSAPTPVFASAPASASAFGATCNGSGSALVEGVGSGPAAASSAAAADGPTVTFDWMAAATAAAEVGGVGLVLVVAIRGLPARGALLQVECTLQTAAEQAAAAVRRTQDVHVLSDEPTWSSTRSRSRSHSGSGSSLTKLDACSVARLADGMAEVTAAAEADRKRDEAAEAEAEAAVAVPWGHAPRQHQPGALPLPLATPEDVGLLTLPATVLLLRTSPRLYDVHGSETECAVRGAASELASLRFRMAHVFPEVADAGAAAAELLADVGLLVDAAAAAAAAVKAADGAAEKAADGAAVGPASRCTEDQAEIGQMQRGCEPRALAFPSFESELHSILAAQLFGPNAASGSGGPSAGQAAPSPAAATTTTAPSGDVSARFADSALRRHLLDTAATLLAGCAQLGLPGVAKLVLDLVCLQLSLATEAELAAAAAEGDGATADALQRMLRPPVLPLPLRLRAPTSAAATAPPLGGPGRRHANAMGPTSYGPTPTPFYYSPYDHLAAARALSVPDGAGHGRAVTRVALARPGLAVSKAGDPGDASLASQPVSQPCPGELWEACADTGPPVSAALSPTAQLPGASCAPPVAPCAEAPEPRGPPGAAVCSGPHHSADTKVLGALSAGAICPSEQAFDTTVGSPPRRAQSRGNTAARDSAEGDWRPIGTGAGIGSSACGSAASSALRSAPAPGADDSAEPKHTARHAVNHCASAEDLHSMGGQGPEQGQGRGREQGQGHELSRGRGCDAEARAAGGGTGPLGRGGSRGVEAAGPQPAAEGLASGNLGFSGLGRLGGDEATEGAAVRLDACTPEPGRALEGCAGRSYVDPRRGQGSPPWRLATALALVAFGAVGVFARLGSGGAAAVVLVAATTAFVAAFQPQASARQSGFGSAASPEPCKIA